MISMVNTSPLNTKALELKGLSSDEKPIKKWTDKYGQTRTVGNGSKYFEMDTSKKYVYDEENETWNLIRNGGSGSGGISGDDYDFATDQDVINVVNSADWGTGSTPIPTPPDPSGDEYDFATDADIMNVINGANW